MAQAEDIVDEGPTLLTNAAAVLLALGSEEDGLRTPQLAERIKTLSNGAISLTVQKLNSTYGGLLAAGYITKEKDPEPTRRRGNRPHRIRLTREGQAVVAQLAPLLRSGANSGRPQ